ncbi:hypothetical protein CEUSTIGMA_g1941.t1 [Chlamydomonas eustigma]|uniref:Uncharacterized protein n=1 Tax=Chlamydomonas eustigma TaxID=1157962 RepID=A0A250WV40_9CHLO|nr:hypothetical protein CEUSTIGMA_g1941.t1 [Chlamydomonas eustigma]|eukprot:GAX74492.1 hypothetical protein CEUSTIGMA_g1941.t1 [Chlamydomonas eustigma]
MCNAAGCTFCAGMSVFGAIFMAILGICIKANYPYVGEWYMPIGDRGSPTQAQIDQASGNCFIVMGIYMGFTVFAILCIWWFNKKASRTA